jgi:hypothetical protein
MTGKAMHKGKIFGLGEKKSSQLLVMTVSHYSASYQFSFSNPSPL